MNRIDHLFDRKKTGILSVYFTAGYPALNDTGTIIETLSTTGADMIEVGIPFSDSMADGPVIQSSNQRALNNGMSLSLLFRQLADIRYHPDVPLVLMGYLNPVMQFGIDAFLDAVNATGIDGVIIPDLPVDVYTNLYQPLFDAKDVKMIFLITPETSPDRIAVIDKATNGFVYMVTSAGTTGSSDNFSQQHLRYFETVKDMNLRNPVLAGFGIHNRQGFDTVCRYVRGAIIGTGFINALSAQPEELGNSIRNFIKTIRQ